MAPKKAAKKEIAKAWRKKKKPELEKDLRRAYEHLGRLQALEGSLPKSATAQIKSLTELGRQSVLAGDTQSAAEMLKACEHLAFGMLAPSAKESVGDALQDAIVAQYERLLEKAANRWDKHEIEPGEQITAAYEATLAAAESAFAKAAYRKALELVRAAEAMTHVAIVIVESASRLEGGAAQKPKKKLKG